MELLAPAGGIGTALAAFDSGADAVYIGLSKFNARARTENFSFEQLSQLLAYAHKNGKKVHVTLNTLIKESELPELVEYLEELNILRPDAVIVQDIGVLYLIKKYFPNLTVHASTQMGVHNSYGVRFAAKWGAKRIILERQTTLDEIAIMRKKTNLEIEVFGHGALCCALSGGCLFSSFLGGASGNRGKCKQPCRRFYEGLETSGYLFSPADLNVIALIPEFKKIGIDSLKIEGRMKKSDYVQSVVSAYRMVIDADEPTPKLMAEAAYILDRTAGRKSSTGFLKTQNFNRLLDPSQVGIWGFPIGEVFQIADDGIFIKLSRRLHQGDRLRLLTRFEEDGPALTAAFLQVEGEAVTSARAGEICFIKSSTKEAERGAVVCKIGECGKNYVSRAAALPLQRTALDLKISISNSNISVEVINSDNFKWSESLDLGEAKQRPLTAEDVEALFSETASARFELGEIDVEINGNLFFPLSLRKEIRRNFYKFVEENLPSVANSGNALFEFYSDYKNLTPAPECFINTSLANSMDKSPNALPIELYTSQKIEEVLLPQFCPEDELPSLIKQIEKAIDQGVTRFRATNVYALAILKNYKNITIIAAPPLPAPNSQAMLLLRENNVTAAEIWPELEEQEAIALLQHSCLPLQQHVEGAVELLQTRLTLPVEGEIVDRRGNKFRVIGGKLSKIVTAAQIIMPQLETTGAVRDLRYETGGAPTQFNWNGEWL